MRCAASVRELREPFAAALENDRRLRELTALRRAAEADRTSLLARLGRKQMVDAVVGAEGGLAGVMERVEMVAGSDLPVLILGETGSGKEVVARAVHTRSRRAQGPVHARQLRRDPARAGRLGAVRTREGQLHRRGRRAGAAGSSVGPRHAAAGRGRRPAAAPRRSACCGCCRTG